MTAPRKILLVGGHAGSLVGFRRALIERMVADGHEVHAATPAPDAELAAQIDALGITFHAVQLDRTGLDPAKDIVALAGLRTLMRSLRPEIVLAYTIKPVIYGLLAAWMAGVPRRYALITGLGYAFTGEASGKRAFVQKAARFLYRIALRRAHGVIFQNPDDAALFARLGLTSDGVPVTVVNGSGVDLDEYAPAEPPPPPLVFLMVARLLGDKGVREYASAATRLRDEGVDARFRLVGPHDSNPDAIGRDELATWIDSGAIDYAGPSDDVAGELARCHVFVLPSYREGTPRSTLEALATGRAVVTTDAPGCRETVGDEKNGFLVPVADADALAAAMRKFANDPGLVAKMGEASLKLARARYDVRKVNGEMMSAMGF